MTSETSLEMHPSESNKDVSYTHYMWEIAKEMTLDPTVTISDLQTVVDKIQAVIEKEDGLRLLLTNGAYWVILLWRSTVAACTLNY